MMNHFDYFLIDIGDRKIEVIGLESCLHMGQVRTGLRASGSWWWWLWYFHFSFFKTNLIWFWLVSTSSNRINFARNLGRRLAQCSEIILKTKKTFPMQIDGEPWMQEPATVCWDYGDLNLKLLLSFYPTHTHL